MNTFIQQGTELDYVVPASTTLSVNQFILVGSLLGCVMSTNNNTATAVTGEQVTLAMRGVFNIPKSTGSSTGWAVGAKVYWDNTAKAVTAVSTSNTLIGYGWAAAADGDAIGVVKLLLG